MKELFENSVKIEDLVASQSTMLDQTVLAKMGWSHIEVSFVDGESATFLVLETREAPLFSRHLNLPDGLIRLQNALDNQGKAEVDKGLIRLSLYNEEGVAGGRALKLIQTRNELFKLNPGLQEIFQATFGNISAPFAFSETGPFVLLV